MQLRCSGDTRGRTFLVAIALLSFVPLSVWALASADFDTNAVMTVELKVAPADWEVLRYQHREAEFFPEERASSPTNAYSWFPAEVVIDGRRVEKAEVRKKGYINSNDTKRPALKLRFRGHRAGDREAPALELTLNNNNQDPALIRQSLAYEVFRRAGVPAPLCSFAKVAVNGKSLGIYTRVEPINNEFLKEHFGQADGNLYEGGRSDFRSGWFENFEIKNHTGTNHHADLREVTGAVENCRGSLLPVLERYFDAEEFFRFWAVESLINEGDGYAGNVNNFYLYHNPQNGKFVFIPWGADSCFYSGRGLNGTGGDPKSVLAISILCSRLYDSADGAERYRATLRRVLDEAWNEKVLVREAQRLQSLLAPHLGDRADDFRAHVENLRDFISARRAELTPELEGSVPKVKSKPLEIAKRRIVGHISGQFSTTATRSDPSHPSGPSAPTLGGRLWDRDLVFQETTVQAGGIPGDPSEEQPVIVLAGTIANADKRYVIYLSIDSDSYEAGKPIPIDNTHISGSLIESDAKGRTSQRFGMLRGSLLLKTASRDPRGKIEGEFTADVFSKLPKPTN